MVELARKALSETDDLVSRSDTTHMATKQKHMATSNDQARPQMEEQSTCDTSCQTHNGDQSGSTSQHLNQFSDIFTVDLWNLDSIGELLDSNLDLSVPNFFQDYSTEQLNVSGSLT